MKANVLWNTTFNLSDTEKWLIIGDYISQLLKLAEWSQLPETYFDTPSQKLEWFDYFATLQDVRFIYPNPELVIIPDTPSLPTGTTSTSHRSSRVIRRNSKINSAQQISLGNLAGRNITSINNNVDRDALMRAICYQLGIVDENGIILAQTAQNVPNPQTPKL